MVNRHWKVDIHGKIKSPNYLGRGEETCRSQREASDGAEQLVELGLGLRVHADEDDEGDEAVMGNHLGLLHRPCGPLLNELAGRSLLRLLGLGSFPGLPLSFRLERNPRRHGEHTLPR